MNDEKQEPGAPADPQPVVGTDAAPPDAAAFAAETLKADEMRGGPEARSFTSASPRFEIPSGALATGTYRLELRAGAQSARETTLEIRFDNAMPTATIRSPADRGFGPGESVHVAGIAVTGWSASVGEVALAMDRQLRFEGTVTLHDAFATHRPVAVRVRAHVFPCAAGKRTVALFRLSPQPAEHAVWSALDRLASTFRCTPS